MFKVLIVDDEPFVRKGLALLIKWEEHGFVLCGEAENGKKAVQKIEELQPDVVITDVRMPEMGGLELIKYQVEDLKSTMKFIILSGYDDFKYAQTAIKYGVRQYILKPIEQEELIDILHKLHHELIEERQRQEDYREEINRYTNAVAADTVNRILQWDKSEAALFDIQLLEAVETCQYEKISAMLQGIHRYAVSHGVAPEILKSGLEDFKQKIQTVVSQMKGDPGKIDLLYSKEDFELAEIIPGDFGSKALNFCTGCAKYIHGLQKYQSRGILQRVEEYLKSNYSDETLNLKNTARYFYINPLYLGQLFKQAYHIRFNDYLHKLRIEEAKILLRRTDLKIYEIAEKVGYKDADYFANKFESLEKNTPTQYRKNLMMGNTKN